MPSDSEGKKIELGDHVRFRGQEYTIRSFHLYHQRANRPTHVFFVEKPDTLEVANEWKVTLIPEEEWKDGGIQIIVHD